MKLVLLGGSMRAGSLSLAGLNALASLAQAEGIPTELLDVRALNLPMFLPDTPLEAYPREHHASIRHLIETCRAGTLFAWASPTYHGTISGAFKNALDFLEFLGDDARPYLQGCPIGLLVASDSRTFGAMIQSVHELRGWLAPTQVSVEDRHFDEHGVLHDPRTQRRLARLLHELTHFHPQKV